jgi:ADP-ribosylglycohydrolase
MGHDREGLLEWERLVDRAYGSLIGLAIGDSLGDQARSPENHAAYGITRDLRADDSWSTDDTEFALLVAHELIVSAGNLHLEVVVQAWKEFVLSQTDLGSKGGESEKGAAANLRRGILPPLSGSDNSYNDSDGAAMRVTPVGIACAGDPKRAARLAEIEACISHSRDGIWGAQAVAAGVAVAMTGASVNEIIETARSFIPEDAWLGRWFDRAMCIVDRCEGDLHKAWIPLHDELWTQYRASSAEALSEAFAIFRLTKGAFVEGVITAANFGRDADTLAAVVGALSGALHGAQAIPPGWIEKVRRPAGRCLSFSTSLDIEDIATKLAQLAYDQVMNQSAFG